MPDLPYPLVSTDQEDFNKQIVEILRDLYESRLAGASLGDVFELRGDVLQIKLKDGCGLTKENGELTIDQDVIGSAGSITKANYTAKGVIIVGNGVSVIYALPVGTNGSVLVANSGASGGMNWSNVSAANVTNTPAGGIGATDVQAALNELDSEKAPKGLSGTKVYYVADSSGGAVNRKLTFVDGILTSET